MTNTKRSIRSARGICNDVYGCVVTKEGNEMSDDDYKT